MRRHIEALRRWFLAVDCRSQPLWTRPPIWLCEVILDVVDLPQMVRTSQVYEQSFDDLDDLAGQIDAAGGFNGELLRAYRRNSRPERCDAIRLVARLKNKVEGILRRVP